MKWPLTRRCCWASSTYHYSELIASPALQSLSMLIYLEPLVCWQSSAITGQAPRTSMSNQVKRAATTPWVIKRVAFTVVRYWLFKRIWRLGVKYVNENPGKKNPKKADWKLTQFWKYHLLKWADKFIKHANNSRCSSYSLETNWCFHQCQTFRRGWALPNLHGSCQAFFHEFIIFTRIIHLQPYSLNNSFQGSPWHNTLSCDVCTSCVA